MKLQNTIIYLIGYPGVGKLTTARVLCDATGATLIDNHMANNPIFKIIGADGITPIPEAAWDRVKAVRDILFDTILNVAPKDTSFVLTNVLLNDEGDRALFYQVRKLAEDRGSIFVPVILQCEEEEQCHRVVSPERTEDMKATNADSIKQLISEEPLLSIAHTNLMELDNTMLPAKDTACVILEHTQKLSI
ncbi:MAG: ATP-binding protein [Rickettsiales bacterium]|nr:ATP-binding protein [Rickettsiales bacterium]